MNININNTDHVHILSSEAHKRLCDGIMKLQSLDQELAGSIMLDLFSRHYLGGIFNMGGSEPAQYEDEKLSNTKKGGYLPAVNPTKVGMILNHIYRNKKAGIVIIFENDAGTKSIRYVEYDPTGLSEEQKEDTEKKMEKYKKATSFSGFWCAQSETTCGTYWQKHVDDWEDLGTEEEYKNKKAQAPIQNTGKALEVAA